jgi:NAD+ kinase
VKRIGFILKQDSETAAARARELLPDVRATDREIVLLAEDDIEGGDQVVSEAEFADAVDLAVALGGDGTMLRANRIVGDSGIPVLGINLGRLGFLAPFDSEQASETIRSALAGKLPQTRRMRLRVQLEAASGESETWISLNDAVIHQGAVARLIELNAYLDDGFIASYRADGLIVATPTGSTAYNLAAGGPILLPQQRAMALTPICAHALTMRPLVLSETSALTILPGPEEQQIRLTIDGYWSRTLGAGDRLLVSKAGTSLVVYGAPGKGYFDILREKMHWGVQPERRNTLA